MALPVSVGVYVFIYIFVRDRTGQRVYAMVSTYVGGKVDMRWAWFLACRAWMQLQSPHMPPVHRCLLDANICQEFLYTFEFFGTRWMRTLYVAFIIHVKLSIVCCSQVSLSVVCLIVYSYQSCTTFQSGNKFLWHKKYLNHVFFS